MKQEETFDFQVRTKSKKNTKIQYSLSLERLGVSCSTISEPDVDNYYSCYDYDLSDSDKETLALYTLDIHDFYGSAVDEVVAFLDVLATHDKNLIYNNLIALGNDEIGVKQEIEYLKFDGYEAGLIYWYQVDTGDSVSAEPVFNEVCAGVCLVLRGSHNRIFHLKPAVVCINGPGSADAVCSLKLNTCILYLT
jgi:hypothetical protein